jgi:hypothetical protein
MEKVTFHDLVVKLKELSQELGRTPSLREFTGRGISRRQIDKYKYSKIVEGAGLVPNKHAQTTEPVIIEETPPRILIFDLEVSTKIVHTYQMWDTSIPADRVIQDAYILSYSAKFLGEDTIYYLDTRYSPGCDLHILEALSYLINQATHLCGHNLKSFDLPTLRSRMIQKKVDPIPDLPILDTLKICKKLFKFTSNKLSEVAKYLGVETMKDDHKDFPGISLFTEAMNGNIKAFESMENYCKTDVIVTELILNKLMPWDKDINFQSNYGRAICSCGSVKFIKNGYRFYKQSKNQMYKCVKCAKSYISKQNSIPKSETKDFFK